MIDRLSFSLNPDKLTKIRYINTFYLIQFAYLVGRLNAIPEGDGTLQGHCILADGSGNSDGNRRNHDDLPTHFAGQASGTIATGRHLRFPRGHPHH